MVCYAREALAPAFNKTKGEQVNVAEKNPLPPSIRAEERGGRRRLFFFFFFLPGYRSLFFGWGGWRRRASTCETRPATLNVLFFSLPRLHLFLVDVDIVACEKEQ